MIGLQIRSTDHVFYGTKTKNNKVIVGCYITLYNTTTGEYVGQTQTDEFGKWSITINSAIPTPGDYEAQFYGSGMRSSLPPEGDWETIKVTSTGQDALNVILSLYTHSVTCENDGTVIAGQLGSTGTAQTHVTAYYGLTSLTPVLGTPAAGQYTISGIISSGLSAALNTSTKQDVYVTAFPDANNYGYVDIPVYANPIGSGILTVTKRFTVSKSRKGNDGGSGIIGPSLVYTGTWDSGRTYVSTSGLVEAVKASDNNYYYARLTSLNQNPISSPTYWTYFSNQFKSTATDLLLAQDVAVGRGITLGTSTPDGGSTGVLKTANASSLYVGSGAYLAANAGGTGLFRVGLVSGGVLTRGIAWDGDTSTFLLKAANVSIDSSGNITANGGTIGGWTINSTSIIGGSNPGLSLVVGLNSDTSLGYPMIYAGDGDPSSAPFQVFEDGSMVANNAYINGTVYSSAGQIGGWTITDTSLYNGNLTLNADTNQITGDYIVGTQGWAINGDGSAEFNSVTVRGTIYTGDGTIGSWYINPTYLGNGGAINIYAGADNTARIEVGSGSTAGGINSAAAGSDIVFWGGSTHGSRASAPFRVTAAGALFASSATISGVINSGSGSIGGWTINPTSLSNNNTTLSSAGELSLGTSNDIVKISSTDGTYRLWAGNAAAASAPFSVTKAGAVYAESGTIGGWSLTTSEITKALTNANVSMAVDNSPLSIIGAGFVIMIDGGAHEYYAGVVKDPNAASVTNVAIFAGVTEVDAALTASPFYVTMEGVLYATSGHFTGTIDLAPVTLTVSPLTTGQLLLSGATSQLLYQIDGVDQLQVGKYLGDGSVPVSLSPHGLNIFRAVTDTTAAIYLDITTSSDNYQVHPVQVWVVSTQSTASPQEMEGFMAVMQGVGYLRGFTGISYPTYGEGRGIYAESTASNNTNVAASIGVDGRAYNGGTAIGIRGEASGGNTNWAGFFVGDVNARNKLRVGGATASPTTAAYGIVFGSGEDTNLYRVAADTLKTDDSFVIGGTASADSLGVGTGAPGTDLEVYAADAEIIVHYVSNSRGGIRAMSTQRVALLSTSADDDLVFGYESTYKGTFTEIARIDNGAAFFSVSGEIRATGDIISYYSDGRLKDNVKPLKNALNKLLSVRGVEFDWNKDTVPSRQLKHDVGVIAQEVMSVLPEAVTKEWAVSNDAPAYHSVLYDKLIPLIIEAIRELKEEVDGK